MENETTIHTYSLIGKNIKQAHELISKAVSLMSRTYSSNSEVYYKAVELEHELYRELKKHTK